MHSFNATSDNTWFHNGDFSGDVKVLVHGSKVEITGALAQITIPFSDLLELVHKHQAMQSERAMAEAAAKDGFEAEEELCDSCKWAYKRLGHHSTCKGSWPCPTCKGYGNVHVGDNQYVTCGECKATKPVADISLYAGLVVSDETVGQYARRISGAPDWSDDLNPLPPVGQDQKPETD